MTSSQPAGWTAAELAQAAARGQLDLHYQPLVDLRDHRIAGAEALMRWRHPRLGLLPPGQFLPLAESFGLMPEIGAWVLGEACRQMHKWQGPAWQPFRLAINVSASQVGPTFDDEVKRVLADMALPAELLEIELTNRSHSAIQPCSPVSTPCAPSACASPPTTSAPAIPACNI